MLIHPQEALLQQARALQRCAAYDEYRKRRVVAEHRLGRLVQLGIRQARYFGRVKTRFQSVSGGHGGQPDPGVGHNLTVGQYRWRRRRPSRRPQDCPKCRSRCCRQCCGRFQPSPARTTMVYDFAHVGFTAEIPPPNQGFPARFLGVCSTWYTAPSNSLRSPMTPNGSTGY